MCIYFFHESCEMEIDTQSDWKLSSRGPQVYVMRGCLIRRWGTGFEANPNEALERINKMNEEKESIFVNDSSLAYSILLRLDMMKKKAHYMQSAFGGTCHIQTRYDSKLMKYRCDLKMLIQQ